jgi:uncharacterized membrane protein (UPF0136 family)
MTTTRARWRKELLYLILAMMENCWFYAWVTFLLARGLSRSLPFAATLSMLLLPMYLTRLLHSRETPLWVQRGLTPLLAVLSSLLILRFHIYSGYRASDLSWLGSFLWEVSIVMQRIPPALVLFCAGLYLWLRGIALAQRDLGIESLGFSFRLGIIAFFWLFLIQIVTGGEAAVQLVFAYFFLGLIAVGLARIESVSQSHLGIRSPFGASWLGILAGSTLGVSALSIAATVLFSLRNIAAAFETVGPVVALLGRLASPLGVAVAWVLELLINFLIRIFSRLFSEQSQEPTALTRIAEGLQQFQQAQPVQGALRIILQIIKWSFLGMAFLGALAIVAFSISRIRRALDEESHAQQAVWESGRTAEDQPGATQSRWQRLREELQARLARLRGEDYSLASIRQIYASLVRLATACGFPRREAETPYEYTSTLHQAFAGCDEQVQLITEAYVRVHYGERSFPTAYVQRIREAWLAISARQAVSHSTFPAENARWSTDPAHNERRDGPSASKGEQDT